MVQLSPANYQVGRKSRPIWRPAFTLFNCGLDPSSNLLAKGHSCTTVSNDAEHRLCNNPGKVYHKWKVDDKVVKQVISQMVEPQNSMGRYKKSR
jgi:hypothetical protein